MWEAVFTGLICVIAAKVLVPFPVHNFRVS